MRWRILISIQVRGRRRLRSVVRPCRRCHGTGRVWGGWDFWGHRQHPCPACRYEKWITGFVYAPRKRRPNNVICVSNTKESTR